VAFGKLVSRVGPRGPMAAGMTLMGAGLALYAAVAATGSLLRIETAQVIVGVGLALNTGPVVGVAVSAVTPDLAGLASGIANLARMFGAALGVAVQGTVLATVGHGAAHGPAFVDGLLAALLVGCGVELAGALVALLKVRNLAPVTTEVDEAGIDRGLCATPDNDVRRLSPQRGHGHDPVVRLAVPAPHVRGLGPVLAVRSAASFHRLRLLPGGLRAAAPRP
jgi:MFS family permease